MTLQIHGPPRSPGVQRVLVVLHETGLPFELVPVDIASGEHKTEAWLEKHPFGQIPYMDDDGFILYESRAICRYIALNTKSSLVPNASGIHASMRFEQAVTLEALNFDQFAYALHAERTWSIVAYGRPCNEARVRELAKALEERLKGYERILGRQRYLAGDDVTLADLFHLPYGAKLVELGFEWLEDAEKFPNLARWWKELASRPAWLKVLDTL